MSHTTIFVFSTETQISTNLNLFNIITQIYEVPIVTLPMRKQGNCQYIFVSMKEKKERNKHDTQLPKMQMCYLNTLKSLAWFFLIIFTEEF